MSVRMTDRKRKRYISAGLQTEGGLTDSLNNKIMCS